MPLSKSITKAMSGDIYLAIATVALLFALLYAAIHELQSMSEEEERAYRVLSTVSRVHDLSGVINDAESAQRGFVITGKADFLDPFCRAKRTVPKLLEELTSEPEAKSQEKEISKLKELILKRLRMMDEIVSLSQNGEFERASSIIANKAGLHAHNEIRDQAAEIIQTETKLLSKDLVRAAESRKLSSAFLLVFGAFSAIALVLHSGAFITYILDS